jgi:kynurenine formamidase
MRTSRRTRALLAGLSGLGLFAAGMASSAMLGQAATGSERAPTSLPGFSEVVSLSHINDPAKIPLFPGDPKFRIDTAFTIPEDGFYLEYVQEGTHTGSHYSAPCHFHAGALCADQLSPSDLVMPAVVVDVRAPVSKDPDYVVTVADLKAWEATHGPMPPGAAVLLWTGCARFWADGNTDGEPNYYNCGSGLSGNHQPGFSRNAVKWLIHTGVLGKTGGTGTDTFGPDPASDAGFLPTWLTLRRHRVTLENLTHLGAIPPVGAWVVLGSPRNVHGSGAPGTILALIP